MKWRVPCRIRWCDVAMIGVSALDDFFQIITIVNIHAAVSVTSAMTIAVLPVFIEAVLIIKRASKYCLGKECHLFQRVVGVWGFSCVEPAGISWWLTAVLWACNLISLIISSLCLYTLYLSLYRSSSLYSFTVTISLSLPHFSPSLSQSLFSLPFSLFVSLLDYFFLFLTLFVCLFKLFIYSLFSSSLSFSLFLSSFPSICVSSDLQTPS